MHEIRIIPGNVAAPSEPVVTRIVPGPRVPIVRSLTMIRKDPSTGRDELFPVLLKARQHREIALIQYRTTVSLDVAGARTLLLLGSTMLGHGGAGKEKREGADAKDVVVHGTFAP